MLWFKRPPESGGGGASEVIEPVALPLALDERVFTQKFAQFLELLGAAEGIDPFVAALNGKHALFAQALSRQALESLDFETLQTLVETVMPARKRVWPSLEARGIEALRGLLADLLYGKGPLEERLAAFVAGIPVVGEEDQKAVRKVRRAVSDLAAECVHFRAPVQYPLMAKWVWDQGTHSGALREFVKGGDALDKVNLGTAPGVYEAGRRWLAERMAENGLYRDPEFVVDVFMAHAYGDYMRALSSGMGLLNAHFGGKDDPFEVVRKLLGIDATRSTASRVKKVLH